MSSVPPPLGAPQQPVRSGTVLLFSETCDGPVDQARRIPDAGWKCVTAQNLERARWLASVRSFGLVVVAGQTLRWIGEALDVLRPLTGSPLLVLSPDLVQRQPMLLRSGADMVLDVACGDELFHSAVQALARRGPPNEPVLRYLEAEGLTVDLWGRRTTVDGTDVNLTPTEFDILRLLMMRSQIAVRHHEILRAVWNWKYTDERNALRLQINRLRSKLADASGRKRFIKLVRGVGYVFDKPVVEFADDRDMAKTGPARESANVLMEGMLRDLIKSLIEAGDRRSACTVLVQTVVAEGMCDGAAVFALRPGRDILELVTHAGMPEVWQRAVAGGLPLVEKFLATDTFNTRQMHHYVDIADVAPRYRPTVRLMRAAELPAQLSVPLIDHNAAWGQAGFARRSDNAFTSQQCMVLESAAAVLGALFADEPAGHGAAAAPRT